MRIVSTVLTRAHKDNGGGFYVIRPKATSHANFCSVQKAKAIKNCGIGHSQAKEASKLLGGVPKSEITYIDQDSSHFILQSYMT